MRLRKNPDGFEKVSRGRDSASSPTALSYGRVKGDYRPTIDYPTSVSGFDSRISFTGAVAGSDHPRGFDAFLPARQFCARPSCVISSFIEKGGYFGGILVL